MLQQSKKSELDGCNFVKTVLMLLVVLGHSLNFWLGTWFTKDPVFEAPFLGIIAQWIGTFHIYAFTLVSGYIFYYVKYTRGGYQKLDKFIINKAKRLLIPYVFSATVWVAPITSYFLDYSFEDVFFKYVLGKQPGQLWFLFMLFDVFIIAWVLSDFFKSNTFCGLIVIFALFVASKFLPNFFQISTAFSYVTFFWIGFKLRQFDLKRLREIPSLLWIAIDICLFYLCCYILEPAADSSLYFKVLSVIGEYVLAILGALMAFFVLQKLACFIRWSESKVFRFFSERSMTVYLFHQQLIFISIYFLNGRINPYLHALINFVFSMAITLVIASILLKFNVTRTLVGEKVFPRNRT